MVDIDEKIEQFAQLILDSKNIVALTGAGMSTESGIPDFRSPDTGLWNKVDPYDFADINSYGKGGADNFDFMLETGMTIFRAKANKGHKALTRLQRLGKLEGVLTQNIDGLHQRARTQNVVEFHGNVREAICMDCSKIYPITEMINQYVQYRKMPTCKECSGMLKPNAVFFGELLDSSDLAKADEMVANCDLLIVLGSSLLVIPVAFYPSKALMVGAKLCIINIQPTGEDGNAEVVIHEKIGDILPKVVEIVEAKMKKQNLKP